MRSTVWARRCAPHVAVFVLLVMSAVPLAQASGDGPNGINVGIDFNWSNSSVPAGSTASFITSSNGTTYSLNNNSGPSVTPTTKAGGFAFSYSIGGAAQPGTLPGGTYTTWTPPGSPPPRICDLNPNNSAPLTLFDCFNNAAFGQIFYASSSGALSNFVMPLTCLNPAGGTTTGLVANLYQITGGGSTMSVTPLASAVVDLSSCPTATSWSGKTFSAADFAGINIPFTGVTLTSGNFYGVYLSVNVQTLTFPAQANQTFTPGGTFAINPPATSSTPNSGNPITYSSLTTGVCTVSGTTVTMVSAGTCTLAANQAGNASYAAAQPVTQSVVISAPLVPTPMLDRWAMLLLCALLGAIVIVRTRTD